MSKKRKKTFYYVTKVEGNKGDRISRIYQIKQNKPNLIGCVEWRYGSSKGADAEVMKYLIEHKHLPKYLAKVSQCSWRGSGYYCPEIEDLGYYIKELD